MSGADGKSIKQDKRAQREARLQQQLRANLRRRKQQAVARRDAPEDDGADGTGAAMVEASSAAGEAVMDTAQPVEWRHSGGRYLVHCDPARGDEDRVVGWLQASYWARGVPAEVLRRSFAGARCYHLVDAVDGTQIGFARVLSDGARLAWLSDVVVDEARRGQGLGRWLIELILADPALRPVRRFMLATADAAAFYRDFGFETVTDNEIMALDRAAKGDG